MKIGKWFIEPFDSKLPKYGGHWCWIGNLLNLDYLMVSIDLGLKIGHVYYDGYHHYVNIGIISINWGGWPYIEREGS